MGLPIWVEPSEQQSKNKCCATLPSSAASKPSDLTPQSRAARSSIRRQPTVRYPNGARPRSLHTLSQAYLRGSLRSPPPAPPSRDIPPVPSLPSQRGSSQDRRANLGPGSAPDVVSLHPQGSGYASLSRDREVNPMTSPRRNPFFSEVAHSWRPRSRRGTITNERETASPAAIDPDLPPLRRMGHRSINERQRSRSRSPNRRRPSFRVPRDYLHDDFEDDHFRAHGSGLGDRDRSLSPDADQWETLLTTITPDPSLPSAETSFNSAAASFPGPSAHGTGTHPPRSPRLRPLRPIDPPLSPLSQPIQDSTTLPPNFDDENCLSDSSADPLPPESRPSHPHAILYPYSRNAPGRFSTPPIIAHTAALQELYAAITALAARTNRLIQSFSSLADSFRSSSPSSHEAAGLHSSSDDVGATLPNISTAFEPARVEDDANSDATEIRALVNDVNALHDSLEQTVRARAEARARRVSGGADPLRSLRRVASGGEPADNSSRPAATRVATEQSIVRMAREELDRMNRSASSTGANEERSPPDDTRATLRETEETLRELGRVRGATSHHRRQLEDARARLEDLRRRLRIAQRATEQRLDPVEIELRNLTADYEHA